MAALKAASLAFDGWWKPVIFRTNCKEAARTSSGVTGGSKLKSVRMLRHIGGLQESDQASINGHGAGLTRSTLYDKVHGTTKQIPGQTRSEPPKGARNGECRGTVSGV